MTVGRDYLLKKPPGPSLPKFFLDTRIVPLAVNLAGTFEVALDRAARRMGVRPSLICAGLAAAMVAAAYRFRHRSRPVGRRRA